MAQAAVKKSPWARFGKALHIVVVFAFFLPFFGVSCDGIDVITVSGGDMAMGCQPGGAAGAAQDEADKDGGMSGDIKVDKVKIEPLAILALVLAIGGVVAAFALKGHQAIKASLIASVLCLGAVIGIWVKVGGEINSEIADKMKADIGKNSMMKESKVESGSRMGLWITLAGLAGIAALAAKALKEERPIPEARVIEDRVL